MEDEESDVKSRTKINFKIIRVLLIFLIISITLKGFTPDLKESKLIEINELKEQIEVQKELSHKDKLTLAIIQKESRGNDNTINYKEMAYGPFQIRQIYLDEYYRLSGIRYTLRDMLDRDKALKVFTFIMDNKCPTYNIDSVCAVHNAGSTSKRAFIITSAYKRDIEKILKTI